jgi:hypothetical protein
MTVAAPPDRAVSLQARIRSLSLADALRLARTGDLAERVLLERLHGRLVWEALLRNAGLTPPEVARIAGMGTLPGPLVEVIVANPGWLANEHVRRALLSNPALRGQAVVQVLRALPRHELELAPKQTAYPSTVRELARRLLRG